MSLNRRGFLCAVGSVAFVPSFALASELSALISAVDSAPFIAIGERHDNPDHHRLQAALVEALAPAALAFEMIPQEHEAAVNRMRREGAPESDLRKFLETTTPGWEWPAYLPILAAAPKAYIACGALSKDALSAVYAKGAQGLGSEMTKRYALDKPLPDAMKEEMLDEQYFAHCEMMPRERLSAMVDVQRAWDASYAEAWRRAAREGGGRSILICGNAHARLDRGAPAYLRRAQPEAKIASVGMLEEGDSRPEARFTVTHSSPAPEREDPCEQMRKAMEKKG